MPLFATIRDCSLFGTIRFHTLFAIRDYSLCGFSIISELNKEFPAIWLVEPFLIFIKSILKSLVILAIWLVLGGAIYSRIAPFFAPNRIFFSANENGTVKQNNQSDSKVGLKESIKFQENERQKVIVWRILQLLLPKLCYCFSPKIVRFQNGSNKVAIELRVVQFWSEIIRLISKSNERVALHSLQLPLFNNYPAKSSGISSQTIFRENEQDNCFIIQQIDNKTARNIFKSFCRHFFTSLFLPTYEATYIAGFLLPTDDRYRETTKNRTSP